MYSESSPHDTIYMYFGENGLHTPVQINIFQLWVTNLCYGKYIHYYEHCFKGIIRFVDIFTVQSPIRFSVDISHALFPRLLSLLHL